MRSALFGLLVMRPRRFSSFGWRPREHLNDRRNNLWHPDYTDLLRDISNRSVQVKEAVNLRLEMADTQDKLDRLQERTDALGS